MNAIFPYPTKNNKSYNVPTFSIHRADGSKVPTLKKAFIIKELITLDNFRHPFRILEDGTEWQYIFEAPIYDKLLENKQIYCIVSYQAHTYGNFAVARPFNGSEAKLEDMLCI